MSIKQLAYVVLGVDPSQMQSMRRIFDRIIRAETEQLPNGHIKVRLDSRDFRVLLVPTLGEGKLLAAGWEVDSEADLESLTNSLQSAGHAVAEGTAAQCAERGVRKVVHAQDSEGFPLELVLDQSFADSGFGRDRFICGEQDGAVFGLGHVVQVCTDLNRARRFYTEVLGLRPSDEIDWKPMGADLHFYHCNARHHSLALINEALGLKGGNIDHVMFEAKSREQVEQAYEALSAEGCEVSQTLGQHTNDEVVSFYMKTPAGFRLEFGFGGKQIDESWEFKVFDGPSLWGHAPVF
jgi:2,3-dihydroxybiphenyl 1,2-dioxygenase